MLDDEDCIGGTAGDAIGDLPELDDEEEEECLGVTLDNEEEEEYLGDTSGDAIGDLP